MSKLVNLVDMVLIWDETWLMWVTVSALSDWRAVNSVIVTSSSIDRTSLISYFVLVHPFKSKNWLTTVTSIILLLTGNNNLWGDVDIGPSSLSSNLDSIRERRGGSMSPA